ncbi:InlB B-repeat-containing protein [Algoriphagus aquimarinus]|uniref:Fibronectin type-III domain-containing protein n=1 Tax=Algoriphagus aquimarinus TaxID=237018 RepID=A0A1I1CB80_9BACT|nr:hypothetical protein [Algoriphagus aquimarinus]SFB57643.1 hypothetical protein SAMN04489723_12254 [Algoriphagus aquimarinus]
MFKRIQFVFFVIILFASCREENIPVFVLNTSSFPENGGRILSSNYGNEVKYGETITLTAIPNDGYFFYKWDVDYNSYDSIISFEISGHARVVAIFVKEPKVIPTVIQVTRSSASISLQIEIEDNFPIDKLGYFISDSEGDQNLNNGKFNELESNSSNILVDGLDPSSAYRIQFYLKNQRFSVLSEIVDFTTRGLIPLKVGLDNDWVNVQGSVLQKSDGTLYTFNVNETKKIGDQKWISFSSGEGTSTSESQVLGVMTDNTLWQILPELQQIGLDNDWSKVFLGNYSTNNNWGIKEDGTLWNWKGTDSPKLHQEDYYPFVENNWTDGSIGGVEGAHLLLINNDGSIWGVGANQVGQLGNGLRVLSDDNQLVKSIFSKNAKFVAAGGFMPHSLAIDEDGGMWQWGAIPDGSYSSNNNSTPTLIEGHSDWVFALTGFSISYGIKIDGSLWSWGANEGNYGDGLLESSNIPVKVNNEKWLIVSQTLGIKKDNTLWYWNY